MITYPTDSLFLLEEWLNTEALIKSLTKFRCLTALFIQIHNWMNGLNLIPLKVAEHVWLHCA